ncbi:MAG TPA: hypothetical protein VFO06_10930 [Gemmatimonadales bacterium]|nr:hypothetical protein [Gemmatimonadales bacterium]
MVIVLVTLAAILLAVFTYLRLEGLSRLAWLPIGCRVLSGAALGLLLVNLTCPAPTDRRPPLVLLDASLSMGAAGGRWQEAADTARALGEVRMFGDGRDAADSTPSRGASRLGPALSAAAATGRRVTIVTDGEIEDAGEIPADLLSTSGVRLFPRNSVADLGIGWIDAPARVTAGDSLVVTVELRATEASGQDSASVELRLADRVLVRKRATVVSGGIARYRLAANTRGLPSGTHIFNVAIAARPDGEPRDDRRRFAVTILPTPGIVLLASPGDWDARFLYRAARGVAELPVRGYVRLAPSGWRRMDDLTAATEDEVRAAARGADLLVLKGDAVTYASGSRARGVLLWPGGEAADAGDWYFSVGAGSPVTGAFAAVPLDSLPPASRARTLTVGEGEWIGLTAQEGRRGFARPVLVGGVDGSRRRVTVGADGLWRWALRGGSTEQAYRALVSSVISWLVAGPDTAAADLRLVRPVAENGTPLVFERQGDPRPAPITLEGPGGRISDTLRFDGRGRAALWLPPGEYRFVANAARPLRGIAAVDEWSEEWWPRPMRIRERPMAPVTETGRRSSREMPWLFLAVLAGLAGEWTARRRLGLR